MDVAGALGGRTDRAGALKPDGSAIDHVRTNDALAGRIEKCGISGLPPPQQAPIS
jgi:hypothetical protein